jgi:hypothetical protein
MACLFLGIFSSAHAQPPASPSNPAGEWNSMRSIAPRGYLCNRTSSPILIDGALTDDAWSQAPWTENFVDIQGPTHATPKHRTRAKFLWDDTHLYIAAELTEPHLQGSLSNHDAVIFHDNDFEVFIDPDGDNHRYAELEINAVNTTWDLFLDRPYKDGGKADNSFEIEGLKSAVHLDGTLNDPSDTDRGWTIEIAIPFASLKNITQTSLPPRPSDRWRLNFSRVEWDWEIADGKYVKRPGLAEDNWVWSPQGIIDMHRPERWGFMEFRDSPTSDASQSTVFQHDATLTLRDALMEVYHRQRERKHVDSQFAESWEALGWTPLATDSLKALSIRPNASGYRASIAIPRSDGGWDVGTVGQDSQLSLRNWSREIVAAIERAGSNQSEIVSLLCDAPEEYWESARFLAANMPDRDLKSLKASFLLHDIAAAHESLAKAPWGAQIPQDIFLNNILPYANINERRDAWREDFRDRFGPLIAEAKTPAQAAALLNQKLFPLVKVKYSTKRAKADQNPYESIQSGLASCTGLSILLIDACRSLGIPARFVGTPLWSDNSGNHSWVEVWDDGWHFTGAAEPSGDKLDEAWFIGRASTAQRDDLRHAIYAVSFQKTPLPFPLVWDRSIDYVSAVNVTDRYILKEAKPPAGTVMVSFRVLDATTQTRVEAHVRVSDPEGSVVLDGLTKDERFDGNDHLHQYLKSGTTYSVEVTAGKKKWLEQIVVESKPRLISWTLDNANPVPSEESPSPLVAPTESASGKTLSSLRDYLKIEPELREPISIQPFAKESLSKEEALLAEKLLSADYRSTQQQARRAEMDSRVIQIGEMKMPFSVTVFGEKPEGGRSLFLSMHGGGGAPSRVNDSQWENQKKLYQLEEGVYVAPRAPTDTWDLWHQSHIDGFFDRLIEDMVLFEEVNPDRVYLMGYSAGGDGVYQVAPRMADRFAAASMMAGHPNETSPLGLRNLPFAIHMGEKDSAYNRNQTAQQWKEKLDLLQSADPEGYVHIVKLHEGKGHWMDRKDAEALPWMSQFTRNRYPKKIVWKQDDVIEPRFYWLGVDREGLPDRALVVAEVDGQTISIRDCDPDKLDLFLRDDWIDMSQEIKVVIGDTPIAQVQVPRTIATIDETIRERGDPKGAFWGKLSIKKPHSRP